MKPLSFRAPVNRTNFPIVTRSPVARVLTLRPPCGRNPQLNTGASSMRLASLAFTLTVLASSALAAEVKPLVDAEWVKANAGDENVVILDIRDKVAETE